MKCLCGNEIQRHDEFLCDDCLDVPESVPNMNLKRAAEIVSLLKGYGNAPTDLFSHFVEHFDVSGEEALTDFARDCGFIIANEAWIV